MRYFKETFRYLKRAWWMLALVCLPAAVTLGFFVRPVTSLSYLPVYAASDIQGFSDIIWLLTEPFTIKAVYPLFLFFAVIFLTVCIAFSFIEKHFRFGRISLKKPFSEINNYFIPALKVMLIMAGILFVFFALLVSLTALQHYLISGAGSPNAGSVITAGILSLVLFALLCWLCSPLIFMIPLMQIYGYSFGDALASSVSYYGNDPFKITFGFALMFLITASLSAIMAALTAFIPNAVEIIVSIVLHLILLVYISAYCMVTTFNAAGMERRDVKKYGI